MTDPAGVPSQTRASDHAGTYRLVLPPTWMMLPVGETSAAAIDSLLDRQFAGKPMDTYGPRKSRLRAGLTMLVEKARASGGLDVIFPIAVPWQVPISAGIILSQIRSAAPSPDASDALLEQIRRSRPGATLVETHAGTAVREIVERPRTEDISSDALAPLRSVFYTWPVPSAPGSFLVAALTISGQDVAEFVPITKALTTLFDVMMESLEWSPELETNA